MRKRVLSRKRIVTPSNIQLLAARQQQTLSTRQVTGEALHNGDGQEPPTASGAGQEPPITSRTGWESTTTSGTSQGPTTTSKSGHLVHPTSEHAELWQLHFYDPPTYDIIECAKQFSHCDIASIDSFPVRPVFNIKAIKYINEAIAKCQSWGLIISDSKLAYLHSLCQLTSHSRLVATACYQYHQTHAYSPSSYQCLIHAYQLWEDLSSWCSAMRKKARTFITQWYQWDPENCHDRNIKIVKNLLGNGSLFLKDGVDKEVGLTICDKIN